MRRPFASIALAVAVFAVLSGCYAHRTYAQQSARHDQTYMHATVTLTSDDEVPGNLNVVDSHVICDGATIDGDVRTYFGVFEQQNGCTVRGTVTDAFDGQSADTFLPWLAPDSTTQFEAEEHHIVMRFAYGIIVLIMFLLFPLRTRTALDRVEHHPGLSAALGTLAVIAVVPVAVLLAISIVGIPLILVEIAALLGMLWIGEAAIALLIGRRLYEMVRPHSTPSPLAALLVGLVLVTAAELVPVVGWAVFAIVSLVGVGCTIAAFLQERSFVRFQRPGAPGAGPGDGPGAGPSGSAGGEGQMIAPPGGVPMRSS